MAALTADRNSPIRAGDMYGRPVAANAVIFAGALVCLDASGNAVPGTEAEGLTADGRADTHANNAGGAAGAMQVTVRKGIFRWDNAGDIDRTDIGGTAYIDDDQTVTATSTERSAAGVIVDVDDDGVWVRID